MNSTQHMQKTAEENMKKRGLFVHMRGSVEIPSRKTTPIHSVITISVFKRQHCEIWEVRV